MIQYYNRKTKQYEIENVAGGKLLDWIYLSPVGVGTLELLVKKKLFSKIYGHFCDRKISRKKVQKFINDFNIDTNEFEVPSVNYNCFNDFFYRKLKSEARPINMDKNLLISPGDGRLSAYEKININQLLQIKGFTYNLNELIEDKLISEKYNGGTCLVLRLCPTDYHRFHFVDNGYCDETKKINGYYYSVNPISLNKIHKVFCQNKREWCIFHSENLGDIIHIEVGATCVGTIIQTYSPNEKIKKGTEKGYFKFGGSTTILFFEPNKVKIDEEILEQTSLGYETKVLMGETIGVKSDFKK